MPGTLVVEDEVVDQQRSAGFECPSEFPKDGKVVGRRFLVGHVSVDRQLVFRGAEVGRVKVAVDRLRERTERRSRGPAPPRMDCWPRRRCWETAGFRSSR